MFEAKILQDALLKKIVEAIRELVVDANLDCNETGIGMQVCSLIRLAVNPAI
jgi:proliferating cell nuclear antigen